MKDLNLKIHNTNLISLKDEKKDVEIDDGKWDSLFAFLTANTSVIYVVAGSLDRGPCVALTRDVVRPY